MRETLVIFTFFYYHFHSSTERFKLPGETGVSPQVAMDAGTEIDEKVRSSLMKTRISNKDGDFVQKMEH